MPWGTSATPITRRTPRHSRLWTVQDGSYAPLGRQLFIYPSAEALERPEVEGFIRFYIENIDQIVEAAGFIGLNDEQKTTLSDQFDALLGG